VHRSSPFRPTKSGVELFIKATPNAKQNVLKGIAVDANGRSYLKVYVTAVPENNKANEAIEELLSKFFHISRQCIHQSVGQGNRLKTFLIVGISMDEVTERLLNNC
jgi:uncharacterized protein YggU (UPF0235/DUF167 family)